MRRTAGCRLVALVLLASCTGALASEAENPFVGYWALTLPGGYAGWLGVTQEEGYLDASILWGWGSVVPAASVYIVEDELYVTRLNAVERKDASGKVIRRHTFTETISARVQGDRMRLTLIRPRTDGTGVGREELTGKRIPPLPPKPDLSEVKYGEPIELLKGRNVDGWKLTDPEQVNGWSVERGVLVNNPVQKKGEEHINYGNLRTVQEFEDFNLKFEVNVPKGGNSGVYLRGMYEVQISDSYRGENPTVHGMGSIYSRIAPRVKAEKRPGMWQQMDITLLDRHVTVKLNGKTIMDNEPLPGCTGGALWADELRPGPIYLQGDHTAVKYRNIVLTPILE
jgi:hypothetical protein